MIVFLRLTFLRAFVFLEGSLSFWPNCDRRSSQSIIRLAELWPHKIYFYFSVGRIIAAHFAGIIRFGWPNYNRIPPSTCWHVRKKKQILAWIQNEEDILICILISTGAQGTIFLLSASSENTIQKVIISIGCFATLKKLLSFLCSWPSWTSINGILSPFFILLIPMWWKNDRSV